MFCTISRAVVAVEHRVADDVDFAVVGGGDAAGA